MRRWGHAIALGCIIAALAQAAPGGTGAAEKVRVLISLRGPFEMFAPNQAEAEGFFKAEGLDVEFTYAQGGAETVQALATGGVDVAIGSGTMAVISAYGKGAPVRIVSNGKRGASETFWYVRKDSPIKTIKDLDGRVLVYSRPGSTSHLLAQALAKAHGIRPKFVSVGDMASSRTQLMSGQVDTGWLTYPNNYDLVKRGEARVIATGADAPELEGYSVRVNSANANFLRDRRDVALRCMRAVHRGLEWAYQHPEPAIRRWAETLKLDLESAKQITKYVPYSAVTFAPIGNLDGNVRLAVEFKMLAEPLTEAQKKELVDIVYDPGR